MRTKSIVVLSMLLVVGLLVPPGAAARRITVNGSLSVSLAHGTLTNQLVVTALISNPALEKPIVQQLPLPGPLYVLPFFVNQEQDQPLASDLQTILLITNTTDLPQEVVVTLRYSSGVTLTSQTLSPPILANETIVVSVANLVP